MPDSDKSSNDIGGRALRALRQKYSLVGKKHVSSPRAWVVIGLMVGAVAGLVVVSNQSGRVDISGAAGGASGELALVLQAHESPPPFSYGGEGEGQSGNVTDSGSAASEIPAYAGGILRKKESSALQIEFNLYDQSSRSYRVKTIPLAYSSLNKIYFLKITDSGSLEKKESRREELVEGAKLAVEKVGTRYDISVLPTTFEKPKSVAQAETPSDSATCGAIYAPDGVSPGGVLKATVLMINSGESYWSYTAPFDKGDYSLASVDGADNASARWRIARILLPSSPIAPGEAVLFPVKATAPKDAGVYNFEWQMTRHDLAWVSGTCKKSIKVGSVPSSSSDSDAAIPTTDSTGRGLIKMKRVGSDHTAPSAPPTFAWTSRNTAPVSANPANYQNMPAGTHTVYATNVGGYEVRAGICTRSLADPSGCTVPSFPLTPVCTEANCGLVVVVRDNELTKVVFQYLAK